MKRTDTSLRKPLMLAAALLLTLAACLPAGAQVAYRYRDYVNKTNDSLFNSLTLKNHSSIILEDNSTMKSLGNTDARVVFTDIASIPMLYAANPAFGKVEMISITVNSQDDLSATINTDKLNELKNLKYLFLVFRYDACGNGDEACLAPIVKKIMQGTSSKITLIYGFPISV